MKSMSISPQGRSRLNCVCRCRNGLLRTESPPIHIFDGEKVCIQRIKPAQFEALLASLHRARISSGLVSVGFQINLRGSRPEPLSSSTIFREFTATWFSVSRPYRCWLPVIYQISGVCRSFILQREKRTPAILAANVQRSTFGGAFRTRFRISPILLAPPIVLVLVLVLVLGFSFRRSLFTVYSCDRSRSVGAGRVKRDALPTGSANVERRTCSSPRLFPFSGFRGTEDCFNHRHIPDRTLERNG